MWKQTKNSESEYDSRPRSPNRSSKIEVDKPRRFQAILSGLTTLFIIGLIIGGIFGLKSYFKR